MKITIEIDDNLKEEEIVLRCKEWNDDTLLIQKRIAEAVSAGGKLMVNKGVEYYLNLQEVLFFETAGSYVAVHTAGQIYETHERLYELEQILPGTFLRVSKSAILNTSKIRSVRKNIAGASEVEFGGTEKKAYVSRSYFKLLTDKLEEKRLKR